MTYYGLSLNVGDLAGSIYLNSFLYGLVEILAYIVCIFLMDRIGRKILYVTTILLAAFACILSPVTRVYGDVEWLSISFAIVGKFGATGAFGVIWVYASELYPTVMRNSAMASFALLSRAGAAVSPYIANLSMNVAGNAGKILPFAVFGGASLCAGVTAILLPETKNCRLPETLEDANDFRQCRTRKEDELKDSTDSNELHPMVKDDKDVSSISTKSDQKYNMSKAWTQEDSNIAFI